MNENKNYGALTNDQELNNENINEDFIKKKIRMGFIKKVYGILLIQLLLTSFIIMLAMINDSFKQFQKDNIWIYYLCIAGTLVIMIILLCYSNCARSVPTNYLLLFLFTIFESYILSKLCVNTNNPRTVLMAATMTVAIVLSLTLYACVTDTDFTTLGAVLFLCGMSLLIFSLFALFTSNKIIHMIIAALSVLLFSIYLVYDTQIIVGKGQYNISEDDYIIGSIIVYVDVIMIFSSILQLMR